MGVEQMNVVHEEKEVEMEDEGNLWTEILAEVQNVNRLQPKKNVLVLGNNYSGKTSLVAKLKGVSELKEGSGLEYAYIDVNDQTRLSVWVADGDPSHANLLKFALNEEQFPHTLVILVASMTTPWAILDQLQSWMNFLNDHIDNLIKKNEAFKDVLKHCQELNVKKWQKYTDPEVNLDRQHNFDDDSDFAPLPEGVLSVNCGLDIVVVLTKADHITTLEKLYDYKENHFDLMQQWIRRFCLRHGASLFYTSAEKCINCDLLYKYLIHRIYSFPFMTSAKVFEKYNVVIPSGWDSKTKIDICRDNLEGIISNDDYSSVIVEPEMETNIVNTEIKAEEEQDFLARLQNSLRKSLDKIICSQLKQMESREEKLDHASLKKYFLSMLEKK